MSAEVCHNHALNEACNRRELQTSDERDLPADPDGPVGSLAFAVSRTALQYFTAFCLSSRLGRC